MKEILKVENLTTHLKTNKGWITPIEGISFHVDQKECIGLVGESGCGKSITVMSLMRLLNGKQSRIEADSILLNGQEIKDYKESEFARLRGARMSMIFQEPMTSLNPAKKVGWQIQEPLLIHGICGKAEAKERSLQLLKAVGIHDAERVANDYPHKLSGGMRQRVMIAMAMITHPDVLFADEPTTALDVTIQAQILDMLRQLQESEKLAMVLVTHNLGIVAEYCQRVVVMYCGQIVEEADTKTIFRDARHPYTSGLIRCIPGATENSGYLEYISGAVMPVNEYPQQGCRFAPRCPYATERCLAETPPLAEVAPGHTCRCWNTMQGGAE